VKVCRGYAGRKGGKNFTTGLIKICQYEGGSATSSFMSIDNDLQPVASITEGDHL